jgi:hypothetical protein
MHVFRVAAILFHRAFPDVLISAVSCGVDQGEAFWETNSILEHDASLPNAWRIRYPKLHIAKPQTSARDVYCDAPNIGCAHRGLWARYLPSVLL